MRAIFISFTIAASAALAATAAVADEGDCSPPCRQGYACVGGHCASPCNPACGAGEVCTRNGVCLPVAPEAPAAAAAPAPRPAPTPRWQPAADPGMVHFDQERLRMRYERRRAAGVVLIIVGAIVGTVAGVLIGLGEDTMVVGFILAPAELAFVIPGIALTVVGAKGVRRIDKGIPVSLRLGLRLAQAPTDPSHADADRHDAPAHGAVLNLGLHF